MRIKLDLPKQWLFSTELQVRVDDVNYGGHLGNDAVFTLIHEARIAFLKHYGFTEMDVDGAGIIMVDANIIYKSQAYLGDILTVTIGIDDISSIGCDFVYQLIQKQTQKEVARAKTGIVFFDYQSQKVMQVPEKFKELITISIET